MVNNSSIQPFTIFLIPQRTGSHCSHQWSLLRSPAIHMTYICIFWCVLFNDAVNCYGY